ncbi:hypothetical protein BDQ17DRAFT_1333423 [Cyathus striatus]|nr:hypothetical protein BDQ17DRAFT_1333423 [Cyathus striatus]
MDPNTLPKLPEDTSTNLNFTQAYTDVHTITTHPHPYNSFVNDGVRACLLNRVRNLTMGYAHIEVDDDLSSTVVFVNAREGISLEGNNILVKVDGTEPDKGGALLYTAVQRTRLLSTAPGVTDNAIAVASLLALLEYLTTHHVKCTAIFNFNNGEEDGLKVAHAFLEHPWSKITHKFLNLEGAGAGGKRYEMEGLDIAFYSNRAFYLERRTQKGVMEYDGYCPYYGAFDARRPPQDGEGKVEPVYFDGGYRFGHTFFSVVAQAVLVFLVLKYNPYIVHAHPYTLLTSTMSLAYPTTVPFLRCTSAALSSSGVLWKQMSILTYILNALSAYAPYKIEIEGVFFLVGWHFCVLLGWSVERCGDGEPSSESPSKKGRKKKLTMKIDDVPSFAANSWWWMIQAIVSIPFPVILMSQVLILFLASLGQTLTDGSSPIFEYIPEEK